MVTPVRTAHAGCVGYLAVCVSLGDPPLEISREFPSALLKFMSVGYESPCVLRNAPVRWGFRFSSSRVFGTRPTCLARRIATEIKQRLRSRLLLPLSLSRAFLPSPPPWLALALTPGLRRRYHKPARSGSSATNVCPFGARCFYAHLDEDGNDVKDRTPPPPPASSRRTCPYLRGGRGRGSSRGGARGGGGGRMGRDHGYGARGGGGLDDLQLLYPFEEEEEGEEGEEGEVVGCTRCRLACRPLAMLSSFYRCGWGRPACSSS